MCCDEIINSLFNGSVFFLSMLSHVCGVAMIVYHPQMSSVYLADMGDKEFLFFSWKKRMRVAT